MTAWMLYTIVVTVVLGTAALAADRLLALLGGPRRLAWATALVGSVVGPLAGLALRAGRGVGGELTPLVVWAEGAGVWRGPALLMDRAAAAPVSVERVIVGLWITTTLALVTWLVWSWVRLRWERAGWWEGVIDGQSVFVSSDVGPAVIDPIRGGIVMPEWLTHAPDLERRAALLHEQEHLSAGDARLVWSGLVLAVFFPWNLGLWWLVERLRQAVEMDCDARVLGRGVPPKLYADLLLRVSERGASVLGRRIEAMIGRRVRFRFTRGLMYAASAVGLVVLACETPVPPPDGVEGPRAAADVVSGQAYEVSALDQRPERMLCPRMEYPPLMQQAGIEGQVTVQFIVEADGSVQNESIEVLNASNRAFEAPTTEMIAGCKFQPGVVQGEAVRTRVEMPVAFNLAPSRTLEMRSQAGEPAVLLRRDADSVPSAPLIVVDGVIVAPSVINDLDPSAIDHIEVVKGAEAESRYGERAKNGVVLITTKRQ